ncbi:hypothetical protein HFN98_18100 [Rhizobium laguerreae]|uniref:hypothetical protein n=1 Tax=Rhizobium laguerreae TaxID=1076926 RepID=UPI001C8FA7FC|nr:hypothetical protein [Rhizobium laguerreae]MBY3332523.1 hypothetical protein [Rhizobium laguerreae]
MSLKNEIAKKIAADREAGRDISTVVEELFLMIAEKVEKPPVEKSQAAKTSK